MSDDAEHVLKFESDDYYGPTLELVFDCTAPCGVVVKLAGTTTHLEARLSYTLFTDDVDRLIAELTAFRERYLARRRAQLGP